MVRGCESKISKYDLEEIVLDLASKGLSYQKICDELNDKYLSKHNDSISLMAIHRFIKVKRKQFEDSVWNGNYETATLSATNRGMESLERLGIELNLLIELIFRCRGISRGDRNYITRHKREMLSRITNVIKDFGFISNSISYKTDAMRGLLTDFSKSLDVEGRKRVAKLLEEEDWAKRCREAREKCERMYNNKDEVKEDGNGNQEREEESGTED